MENGNYSVDLNAKDYVDTFIKSEFRMTRAVEGSLQLASSYDYSSSYFAEVWFSESSGFYIYGSFPSNIAAVSECHVTVLYTKISD